MTAIVPPATIGMLGGGQLGRYALIAATTMGYRTVVVDPDPSAPAGVVAHEHLVAAYDDRLPGDGEEEPALRSGGDDDACHDRSPASPAQAGVSQSSARRASHSSFGGFIHGSGSTPRASAMRLM